MLRASSLDDLYCGRHESLNLDDKILSPGVRMEPEAISMSACEGERECQDSKDVGRNSNFHADRSIYATPYGMVAHVPARTTAQECLQTAKIFAQALDEQKESDFFTAVIKKVGVSALSRAVSISSEHARLEIDFFDNRFVTCFHGREHELKLSNAIGIINDLSEIFSKITSSKEVEKLPLIEDHLSLTHDSDSESSDVKITVDGVTLVAIYPLNNRVVLTSTRGTSSLPLQMVQNCAHLFDRRFAQVICPLMEIEPSINHLLSGIKNLYLGRCILGLVMSTITKAHSQEVQKRELARIVVLLKTPYFAFHTEPLL